MADWYMAWACDHCLKFGFRDQDATMVLAWREAFAAMFTADELKAATGFLLGSADAPKFASDHRGAIIRAVVAVRQRAASGAVSSNVPRGCIECGGCGLVVVPHPGLSDDGSRMRMGLRMPADDPRGLTRTMCVCCVLCESGRKTREESEKHNRPLLTISQYEHQYPNWRQVQFERQAVLNAGRVPPSAEDVARLNKLLAEVRQREQRGAA